MGTAHCGDFRVWRVSSLCGPLIGGYFVVAGNWRMVFWASAAQGLVAVLVAHPLLRRKSQIQKKQTQALGLDRLVLLAVAVLAICQAGVVIKTGIASVLCVVGIVFLLFFLKQDTGIANKIFRAASSIPGHSQVRAC